MKILIVNTYDHGGAANSCKRLHLALLKQEVDSMVLLKLKQNNWPNSRSFWETVIKPSTFQKIENKIKRSLKKLKDNTTKPLTKIQQDFTNTRAEGLELFSFPNSDTDITQSELYKEADLINLHWVANFMDFKSFFKKNKKPIIWTLHDMNPFSGGEHFEEESFGMSESGLPLKRELTKEEMSVFKNNIEIKKKVLNKNNNLTCVAPSKWLVKKAKESKVFEGIPIHYIPYGLDSKIYSPKDQNYSRDLLGIPRDKKVILFVADSINNNRKGFAFLKDAFKQLALKNLILCTIGNSDGLEMNDEVVQLGTIHDENLMCYAYSAADVFVIPSLMDNLPNTVLESIMCGTPVIGFPVGGIPDMIQDGKNGLLTQDISVSALLETLNKFLNYSHEFDRNEIRENAIKKYDQNIQSNNYIELFQSILKKKKEVV